MGSKYTLSFKRCSKRARKTARLAKALAVQAWSLEIDSQTHVKGRKRTDHTVVFLPPHGPSAYSNLKRSKMSFRQS